MSKPAITLLAKRDLGQKINATFEFITQNFKPLTKALLTIAGPTAFLTGIINGVTIIRTLENQSSGEQNLLNTLVQYSERNNPLASLLGGITGLLAICTVYIFMVLYEEDGSSDSITPGRIWQRFSGRTGVILGTSILFAIICVLGMVLFIIPGIYLAVALSFYNIIILREDIGATESLRRSQALIQGNWWSTFGLLFLMGIIVTILSLGLQIPAIIATGLSYISLNEGINWHGIILILTNVLSIVGSIFIQAIIGIAIAFQYYNLIESKEGAGIRSAIDSIGSGLSTDSDAETRF